MLESYLRLLELINQEISATNEMIEEIKRKTRMLSQLTTKG